MLDYKYSSCYSLDMFSGYVRPRRPLLGIVFLFAIVFFTFGHSISAPNLLALEEGQIHVDEVPHESESDEHSPCPTDLHQSVTARHGQNDPDENLDDAPCPIVLNNYTYLDLPETHLDFRTIYSEQPPLRLPLDQRTHLLL